MEKTLFLSPMIENNVFHYATRKISSICKISTFFEDLTILNPRSHLKMKYEFLTCCQSITINWKFFDRTSFTYNCTENLLVICKWVTWPLLKIITKLVNFWIYLIVKINQGSKLSSMRTVIKSLTSVTVLL